MLAAAGNYREAETGEVEEQYGGRGFESRLCIFLFSFFCTKESVTFDFNICK